MWRETLVVSAAALSLAGSPVHAAPAARGWGAYGNSRFNFAICYPPSFKGQGEAENRDGQRFRTRDGAELTASGINLDEDVGAGLLEDVRDLAGPDARVTYRARKANWLVASGVGAKGEFYVKRVERAGQLLSWELIYPARLHDIYAPLTPRMLSCFTYGTEAGD